MGNAENQRRELAERYAQMPLEQLRQISSESTSLTDMARDLLETEINRRGEIVSLDPIIEDTESNSDGFLAPQLVVLRQFRDLPEALLAKGRLETAGIECSLTDDNMVRMDWFISNFLGGVKLLVRQEDAVEAAAILDQHIPENFDVEGIGEYHQPHCPKCGSMDVSFEELNKPVAYGSAFLKIPFPVHNRGWACHACKHKWDGPSDEPSSS
jgi:hypothetical protein